MVRTSTDPTPTGAGDEMLGDMIRTGLPARGGEWVIWAVRIDHPAAGQPSGTGIITGPPESVTFGFMLGAGMNVNGRDTPMFGYYVGAAEKITSNGRRAELRAWSEDDAVKVFWLKPGQPAGRLAAYDANGRQLPGGRNPGS